MNLWNTVEIALIALRLNAMRSFLTMLGIIIGIASVIVMVSVSSGAQKEVENFINSLGTNMLMVRPGADMFGGRRSSAGSAQPLRERDVAAIGNLDIVEGLSGSVNSSAPVIAEGKNWTTTIYGIHTDYPMVRGWVIEQGRNFTDREVKIGGKVAILGQTVIKELFGEGASPLGSRIRIKNVPFTVIGILEEKGQASFGQDQDDVIFIPISTARLRVAGRQSRTVSDEVGTIMVKINNNVAMEEAQRDLEELLRVTRDIKPGAEDNFSVRNMAEFIRARNETENTLGLLLAATAAISLIVGGIGIMNIMLVSVTERTREIGLRLAVGARQRDILTQFLVEAITLCLIGSLFGVAIGVGAGAIIARLSEWPVLISVPTILIAMAAAAFVGIFFGFYPAQQASRMNPIDALRHE
jgi:putative ABC transport system permease protein